MTRETPEQTRMRQFYTARGVNVGWGMAKDGSYHAQFARDAWAAWQEAQKRKPSLFRRLLSCGTDDLSND